MFPDRKSRWLAILLGCIIAVVCFGTLYFVGDLARFQKGAVIRENQAELRDLKDPQQLEQLLKRYPSNGVLKLVALASKDSIEIDAAALGLLKEADPGELSKRINDGLSGRGDLKALGRDLKAAEDNAVGLESRYDILIKAVHDGIAHDAAALEGGTNNSATFMAMIDAQHADVKALMAKISAARLDYFGAYEKCVTLLASESGIKVVDGRITFRLQAQADSYNEAAAATAATAKRLTDLEAERTALRQSRLDRWKRWASG
jgi:hypothetical protein